MKTISITGAGGNIGYILSSLIADGRLLGPAQRVFLKMIELPDRVKLLEGIIAEIEDMASPLFAGALATSDPKEGFKDADYILLVGSRPRSPGMERADLIQANAGIFSSQGKVINEVANPGVKIVVVGNPVNTNAYVLSQNAPKIPRKNITCLTRLDYNRAVYTISDRLKISVGEVSNPIVWGNHSKSMGIDVSGVRTSGKTVSIGADDVAAIEKKVQNRGGEIIEKRGQSSCFSAAIAICDHVRDWALGTKEGHHVSMGVFVEDGEYGIPNDVCCSCPVTCKDGEWYIVKGLELPADVKDRIKLNVDEMRQEIKEAAGVKISI